MLLLYCMRVSQLLDRKFEFHALCPVTFIRSTQVSSGLTVELLSHMRCCLVVPGSLPTYTYGKTRAVYPLSPPFRRRRADFSALPSDGGRVPHVCGGGPQGDSSAGVPHRAPAAVLADGGEIYSCIFRFIIRRSLAPTAVG